MHDCKAKLPQLRPIHPHCGSCAKVPRVEVDLAAGQFEEDDRSAGAVIGVEQRALHPVDHGRGLHLDRIDLRPRQLEHPGH